MNSKRFTQNLTRLTRLWAIIFRANWNFVRSLEDEHLKDRFKSKGFESGISEIQLAKVQNEMQEIEESKLMLNESASNSYSQK